MTTASTPPEQAAEPAPRVALTFCCPKCERTNRLQVGPGDGVRCANCGWVRAASAGDFSQGKPARCLVCGCTDLWRQKDFSARAGLLMVGTAILCSTVAYAFWQPLLALAILMVFALVDAILFLFMRDVSVCYRCGARHGGNDSAAARESFDLEVAERYRQERLRRQTLSQPSS